MDPKDVMHIAAAGLRAQSARMRIIAENVANAASTAETPDADPYRRRAPVFRASLDRELQALLPQMTTAAPDRTPFRERYEPGHPAANADGMVKYPNVQTLIEMMDMRTAQRSYEANLNVIEAGRSMAARTLDLLRR